MGQTRSKKSSTVSRALQVLLSQEFERHQSRYPSYSLRAFARRLEIAPSALSEILRGKRQASGKLALRIAERLNLDAAEKKDFLRHLEGQATFANHEINQLSDDQYALIAGWEHFAILSLAETKTFCSDPEWIARRLAIEPERVRAALARLIRGKFLKQSPSGRLKVMVGNIASPDQRSFRALRQAHAQNLRMALEALETVPIEMRDFTAVTMAIDPSKLPEAALRIREFERDLCAFLESGSKTEVYKICLQLYPLTCSEDHRD